MLFSLLYVCLLQSADLFGDFFGDLLIFVLQSIHLLECSVAYSQWFRGRDRTSCWGARVLVLVFWRGCFQQPVAALLYSPVRILTALAWGCASVDCCLAQGGRARGGGEDLIDPAVPDAAYQSVIWLSSHMSECVPPRPANCLCPLTLAWSFSKPALLLQMSFPACGLGCGFFQFTPFPSPHTSS